MELPELFMAPDESLMRLIPPGRSVFGSSSDEIESAIHLDRDGELFSLEGESPQFVAFLPAYYIGVFAITNQQFVRFLSQTRPSSVVLNLWMPWRERIRSPEDDNAPYRVAAGFEKHPVANVSWSGAQAYSVWAGLRLPTEMEWEKAARGADGQIFPWGDLWSPEKLCWHGSHLPTEDTAPVDSFENGSSPYGIYQMVGNVEEWCGDWYQPHAYKSYAAGVLTPPTHGCERVVRGGNCQRRSRLEFRCAMRRGNKPSFTNIVLTGIRCACSAGSGALP
jgi:formylglycine-generating enzyme required for sulfatase activity